MAEYVIAIYIRLSIEDAKTDSMSIENQRLIIHKYIAGLDIPGAEILEFVDNGHTGTNFERPGVQEMLELVRAGKINCVIVKDFSRFGRNAIETGYFIERVFPLFCVRFISVSDRFDSVDYEGNTGGMEVAFKFLMHEYYSKDLSKKIKSARYEKTRRGEAVTMNAPLGYKLNASRQMVIDEPAAETVRMIFSLAMEGKSIKAIIRALYEKKCPTPGEYKNHRKSAHASEPSCVWNSSVILQTLHNEQYVGTYIAGKTKSVEVGSNKRIFTDRSDWIAIPNHHPAIIDESVFNTVRDRLAAKSEALRLRGMGTQGQNTFASENPLIGKVFCGCCNHSMAFSKSKNSRFRCNFTRGIPDADCHHLRISANELSDMLFEIITKQAQVVLNIDQLRDVGKIDARLVRQAGHDKQIAALNDSKRRLYERLTLGELDIEAYKTEKAPLDAELARLGQVNAALVSELAEQAKDATRQKLAAQASAENGLTRALVDLLIDKVLVFPDNRLEIKWKVKDFFDTDDGGFENVG